MSERSRRDEAEVRSISRLWPPSTPADWVASCCWQRVSERESSRSAEMEEELSTVRRQISLLVQVEGVSPRARGAHPPSPAAPRGGAQPSPLRDFLDRDECMLCGWAQE